MGKHKRTTILYDNGDAFHSEVILRVPVTNANPRNSMRLRKDEIAFLEFLEREDDYNLRQGWFANNLVNEYVKRL